MNTLFRLSTRLFQKVAFPLILLFSLFQLSACKNARKNDFFHVKFEIISSVPVASPYPTIITAAGVSQNQTHTNFTNGTTWQFSTSYETSHRPLVFALNGQNIRLSSAGSVTLNLYVNEKKQGTSITHSIQSGSEHLVTTKPVSYTVN